MSFVHCVHCGYLALRDRATQELRPADERYRHDGYMPTGFVPGKGDRLLFEDSPVCTMHAASFESKDRREGFEKVSEPRMCEQFVQFQPGLSPREHLEMKLLQEVEQRNLNWQRQVEAIAETRHQELRADQKKAGDRSLAIASISAFIALASAVIALAALLTKN